MKRDIKSLIPMVFVTIVLCLGFITLYYNQSDFLNSVVESQENTEPQSLNLDKNLTADKLSSFLINRDYVSDYRDADFIAKQLIKKIDSGYTLHNLGAINTNLFKVSTTLAETMGGSFIKSRCKASKESLGFNEDVEKIYDKTIPVNSFGKSNGNKKLKVKVLESDAKRGLFGRTKYNPSSGVLVCLRKHELVFTKDTIVNGKDTMVSITDTLAADAIVEYAFTNDKGFAQFDVYDTCNYSVIPIKAGCNYGPPKGTLKNKKFVFKQSADKIKLFDSYTYKRIKDDVALTVRTPETYRNYLIISFLLFLVIWWLLYGFILARDRYRQCHSDTLLLPILMTLTGLGLLSKFALVNPVCDKLLGWDTLLGTLLGVVAMGLIAHSNVIKFYNNGFTLFGINFKFDFVMQFLLWTSIPLNQKLNNFNAEIQRRTQNRNIQNVSRIVFLLVLFMLLPLALIVKLVLKIPKIKSLNIPNGFGYLLMALSMLVLLFFFGSGPEGSNAKVNLGPFQVSELAKFLTMFFIAAFFSENADTLQAFSEKQYIFGKRQAKLVSFILLFMLILMGIYLKLSDMGPAVVVMMSFILIYSVARRDTIQLLLGVASFILLLFLAYKINGLTLMAIVSIVWFVLWVAISWLYNKRIYESAVFFNIIIMAFIFGGPILDTIGFHNEATRITDRNEMVWNGVWNNDVK